VWGEVGEIGKAGAGFGLVGLRVGRKSFLGTRANSDALTLESKKKLNTTTLYQLKTYQLQIYNQN
jgi:hypothetical protein